MGNWLAVSNPVLIVQQPSLAQWSSIAVQRDALFATASDVQDAKTTSETTLSIVLRVQAAVAALHFAGPWMTCTTIEHLQRTLQLVRNAIG